MNRREDVAFPLAPPAARASLPPLHYMDRLLTVAAMSLLPILFGCASMSETAETAPSSLTGQATLTAVPTADLQARRETLATQIQAIERDVEMKAGLHMGVTISDERGRLTELYREAGAIEKELVRRSAYSRR